MSRIPRRALAGLSLLAPMLLSSSLARAAVTLEQAMEAARQGSVDRAMAAEQTALTESMRGQAWSLLSPKLVSEGSYTINEREIALDFAASVPEEFQSLFADSEPIVVQEKSYAAASVSVVQSLLNAPALPLLRGAYAMTDAARDDEQSADQRIRAGVARAFYGLAVAREAVLLTDNAVLVARAHRALAEAQVQAGLAPQRASLQARLAEAQALREQAAAHEREVMATEAFVRLTGLPRDVELAQVEPLAAPTDLDEAVQTATQARPDLQAAETRVRVAGLSRVATGLGWLPTVDGRFTYAWTQNEGFSGEPTVWMVVFSANWTLWDGGYRLAKMGEQQSQVRLAELQARKLREGAEEEVRVAWARYHQAEIALQGTAEETALAAESLRLAEASFAAGGLTMLEVEDARLGVVQAELGRLGQRMNRDLAAIDLRVAMGEW